MPTPLNLNISEGVSRSKIKKFISSLRIRALVRLVFPEADHALRSTNHCEFLLLSKFLTVSYCLLLIPFRITEDATMGKYQIKSWWLQRVGSYFSFKRVISKVIFNSYK